MSDALWALVKGAPSFFPLFYNTGTNDLDLIKWPVFAICLHKPHALDHPHPALHAPENCVLSVQPRRRSEGDEELTTVGVRPTVGHAQDPSPCMLKVLLYFILEFLAVDGTASPASAGRIARLYHEVGDNAVENDVVIVAPLRKGCEIFACLEEVKPLAWIESLSELFGSAKLTLGAWLL